MAYIFSWRNFAISEETLWEIASMADDSPGPLPDFRYEKITDIKKPEAV